MDDRALIMGRDLDRRMGTAGRGTADQQRFAETLALHLGRDMAHLLERWRDQSRESDGLRTVLLCRMQNLLRRHHDAEVDDFIAVARQDDADDVLADIVHVALDSGDDDLALGCTAASQLVGFDEGHKVGNRLLHDPRRFHYLRQEHLAGAEKIANSVHACHQRTFDHRQRWLVLCGKLGAALLGIGDDMVSDAAHQGVLDALADRPGAPGEILDLFLGLALDRLSELDQDVARIFAIGRLAVEHHILNLLAQGGRKVIIDAELTGIDDAHGEAGLDGVIKKYRVNRLAHRVVAAERERNVGDAAGDRCQRQVVLDPARRFDEIDGVIVVFGNAGSDGEHVGIENDVFGREAVADQQVIGALTDLDLALVSVRLASLVEGHDDDGGAIATRQPGLLKKPGFAFLHRDRIDDALALDALQARLDYLPFGGVDHQRHLGDVRLGGDQVEEARHR